MGTGRTRLRQLAAVAVLLLVVSPLLHPATGQSASQPLKIILATGGSGRTFEALARDFEASTGTKPEIAAYPYDTAKEKQLLELTSGTGNLDVVLMDDVWLVEFAQFLEPLDPLIRRDRFDIAALIPAFVDLFKSPDGAVLGLPARVGGWVLYYRSDLFTKNNIRLPLSTWDEFLDAAKKLTEGGTYGFAAALKQGDSLVFQWVPFLYSFGGQLIDVKARKAAFNTPEGRAATEFFVDLYRKNKVVPPGAIQWENDGVISAMQQGLSAMAITFSPYLLEMADPNKSQFAPYIRVASKLPVRKGSELRTGITVVAGWGFGLAKSSKNKAAAWNFLKFVASREAQKRAALRNANAPTVASVFTDPEFIRQYPEAAPVLATLLSARPMPHVPKWTAIEDAIASQLSAAVSGIKAVPSALTDAERAVNELMR